MKWPIELDRYLKPLVIVLIVLSCGPEVFAVIELTTLLELLGASLFLFVFATSFRALAASMLDSVGRVLVPLESRALIQGSAGPWAILIGLRQVLFNGVALLALCMTLYAILSDLLR